MYFELLFFSNMIYTYFGNLLCLFLAIDDCCYIIAHYKFDLQHPVTSYYISACTLFLLLWHICRQNIQTHKYKLLIDIFRNSENYINIKYISIILNLRKYWVEHLKTIDLLNSFYKEHILPLMCHLCLL